MVKKYIMALDEGTSSARTILYDRQGNEAASAKRKFAQIYPEAGWVEHDALEIWKSQYGSAVESLAKAGLTWENVEAIGITNQRETTVVWDKNTGEPVYNAIVWQCKRTSEYCDSLKKQGFTDMIRSKTGLGIDSYFSGTKLRWILENVPGVRDRAEAGELLFGTIETWLIWKLTGGKVHITDYSNASRTMMFNINTLEWDDEILSILNIPKCMLPEPRECSTVYGETDPVLFGGPIKISGAAGDQQASLFGQTCFAAGESKMTFGTGGFLLMNTGEKPVMSENGLLTTIAWGLDGRVSYALEGSVFIAAAALQWLHRGLEILDSSEQSEEYALDVKDSNGVYVVPAFTGLGAPYWDQYARGAILGLTRGATKKHVARATLESLAYQTADLISAMEEDLGNHSISTLKVDGGASQNDFMLQFQADLIDKRVVRPVSIETTSLGAAYLAGLASGYWSDTDDVIKNWQCAKEYEPSINDEKRADLLRKWHKAVSCVLGWAKDMED